MSFIHIIRHNFSQVGTTISFRVPGGKTTSADLVTEQAVLDPVSKFITDATLAGVKIFHARTPNFEYDGHHYTNQSVRFVLTENQPPEAQDRRLIANMLANGTAYGFYSRVIEGNVIVYRFAPIDYQIGSFHCSSRGSARFNVVNACKKFTNAEFHVVDDIMGEHDGDEYFTWVGEFESIQAFCEHLNRQGFTRILFHSRIGRYFRYVGGRKQEDAMTSLNA